MGWIVVNSIFIGVSGTCAVFALINDRRLVALVNVFAVALNVFAVCWRVAA
jgi:uncharacterized membrane protein